MLAAGVSALISGTAEAGGWAAAGGVGAAAAFGLEHAASSAVAAAERTQRHRGIDFMAPRMPVMSRGDPAMRHPDAHNARTAISAPGVTAILRATELRCRERLEEAIS